MKCLTGYGTERKRNLTADIGKLTAGRPNNANKRCPAAGSPVQHAAACGRAGRIMDLAEEKIKAGSRLYPKEKRPFFQRRTRELIVDLKVRNIPLDHTLKRKASFPRVESGDASLYFVLHRSDIPAALH